MKVKVDDYIGKKFGMITVIGQDLSKTHFNSNSWLFRCDCGTVFVDKPNRILSGHKKSCGCQKGKVSYIHGCNGDEFYPTWWGMMQRCYNTQNHNYSRYGLRGITVCSEWHDPKVFIDWARKTIEHKKKGMTLDRIDNDKGYSPDNCRWATMKTQSNNRRSNTLYIINGETKTFTQWCEYFKISDDVVWERINKLKWDIESAFKTPVLPKGKRKPK